MFGWFRKKEEPPQEFESNRAAFDYACEHLPNSILLEAVLPAMVEAEGRRGIDGERFFSIRLAGPNGGREMWACTLAEATDWPAVGDLVGFRVVTLIEDLDPDGEPVGYISSVLEPVLVRGTMWRIARNLTPDNIKRPLRL